MDEVHVLNGAVGMNLAVVAHGAPPVGRVRIIGDLDGVTGPEVHRTLSLMLDEGYRTLLLDLSQVTTLDVAGVAVLHRCRRLYRDAAGELTVAHEPAGGRSG